MTISSREWLENEVATREREWMETARRRLTALYKPETVDEVIQFWDHASGSWSWLAEATDDELQETVEIITEPE